LSAEVLFEVINHDVM